uniref:Serine/threonine-protein phosphatase 2A 55 kDa regulatory subunit B n=2 Tax=Rhodosorus marinus TaxID=101924 RepID=A0A7S2ZA11_9RHOD|mmetsp:Transcript_11540/g.48030  ORF Transcript_11540/g.48030 Transcript_11540/m.48030 type:complete len:319 (+) Transcript_11540:1460-2416(+)
MDHFQGRNGISNTAVPARSSPTKLTIPRIQGREAIISSNCTRSFANAHTYHINSVSVSSDEETFLSADDLRVNLWHLEKGESGFNVLDLKPENMEDLSEVITCAQFHPEHCNLFAISTSRAVVKLNDLRASALCDGSAKEFTVPDDVSRNQSFFSEIVASISDLKFSRDGKYFCTRDYETLRVWDMRKETEPLKIIPVFEQINSRLVELYENECIFDRFQCAFSNDGSSVVTGSYNGLFCSFSLEQGDDLAVEASVDFVSGANRKHLLSAPDLVNASILDSSMGELVEPVKRIMHVDASPTEKVYAVAAGPSLYIFHS